MAFLCCAFRSQGPAEKGPAFSVLGKLAWSSGAQAGGAPRFAPHACTTHWYQTPLRRLVNTAPSKHNPTLSQPGHSNRNKSCPGWRGAILQICTFANDCSLQHCNFVNLHASAIHARRDRMHISCVVFLQQISNILQICSFGCACTICRCARFCNCKSQPANLQVCSDGDLQICSPAGQHV